ncbi:hypothetical protein V1514DRAFT_330058 [Lipomyces japonicus]|uniref:uncharacterized protein n=1 Tax=Lipomyces japonicus TaxID=56871 RepID=UPI0034CF6F82
MQAPELQYEYSDTDSLQVEVEEWFAYANNLVLAECLVEARSPSCSKLLKSWWEMPESDKVRYVQVEAGKLQSHDDGDEESKRASLLRIFYVVIGLFDQLGSDQVEDEEIMAKQLSSIQDNTKTAWHAGLLPTIYEFIVTTIGSSGSQTRHGKELFLALTVFYLLIIFRHENEFVVELDSLLPPVLPFFISQISRFKIPTAGADDGHDINHNNDDGEEDMPIRNMVQVTWKLVLCLFGDSAAYSAAKQHAWTLAGLPASAAVRKPVDVVTASPLGYEQFRQDVRFRFPGYTPPPVPFLQQQQRSSITAVTGATSANTSMTSADTLPYSSVHVATPAPSPPPSPPPQSSFKPKKSIFQPDRTFPFLFPPPPVAQSPSVPGTVDTSDHNNKHGAEVDTDGVVPVSIREADQIFSKHTRTSLPVVQLWRERDEFMKRERGWVEPEPAESVDYGHGDSADRLRRVERVYGECLPRIQPFVVVLLKLILSTMNDYEPARQRRQSRHGGGVISQLEQVREQEILLKSSSGLILQFMRWCKVTHVLKFEYVSQLLYDSNLLPLLMQFFAGQGEIDRFVMQMPELDEFKFFSACRALAVGVDVVRVLPRGDEVVRTDVDNDLLIFQEQQQQYEQDDGHLDDIVMVVTKFSRRNLFTFINFLRTMGKTVKHKTYRNLMLVQLRCTTVLRKTLRLSHADARLHALKIMKGVIPFSGRKWRHANMRVITAIYIHCRQELRDGWLQGGGTDADGDVDESYAREIALRALVRFYNMRRWPEQAAALSDHDGHDRDFDKQRGFQDEEDFFMTELEAMMINDDES